MSRILPSIPTLEQHLEQLKNQPEDYRPNRCPGCGKSGLWCHGYYGRMSDRETVGNRNQNPIPIPRFRCPHCGKTCSRLPGCIPPRRWYLWLIQQTVLSLLLSGETIRQVASKSLPTRRTISRWWGWLQERDRGREFTFCLRSRLPDFGRYTAWRPFWSNCLSQLSLATAMSYLALDGVNIP